MKLIERLIVWKLRKEVSKNMKAKMVVSLLSALNVGAFMVQLAGMFPSNKYVMAANVIVQALMPSVGGLGHSLFFGGKQEDNSKAVKD